MAGSSGNNGRVSRGSERTLGGGKVMAGEGN